MSEQKGNPEIKRWDTDAVIIPAGKYASIKEAVEKEYKSLYRANLRSADLRSANLSSANLSYANLRSADLSYADLRSANLRSANLSYANLRSANLRSANLSYANLSSADLSSADLSSADLKNIPQLNTPTINEYIEKFKIEKKGEYIYVYKGITDKLESPNSSVKIKYTKGIHKVEYADCDVWADCSYGISLSPTKEGAKEWGSKIIKVKVHIGDISCIPIYGHDKKFRVKKLEVLPEK